MWHLGHASFILMKFAAPVRASRVGAEVHWLGRRWIIRVLRMSHLAHAMRVLKFDGGVAASPT